MEKAEIEVFKQKELTHKVGENIVIQDIIDSKISKNLKMVLISAQCFPRINQLKGELCPEGTIINDIDFSGREIRQVQIQFHINKAIVHSGYGASLDNDDMTELITSVIADVIADFSHLTTQEVGIAFRKGVREEYGEYKGVSTRIFYSWLKSYCNSTKLDANKEFLKLDAPKQKELSKEEREERRKKWLEDAFKAFDEFVETGEYKYYDLNNLLYDYLKVLGILFLSKKDRKEIWEKAEKIVRMKHDPLKVDRYQRPSMLKVIEALNKKDKSVEHKILTEAKHIHLKMFVSDLRKKKKSLRKIVAQKQKELATKKTQQN